MSLPFPSIPQDIAVALPIAGQILVSLLIDDRLKPAINALIASAFLLACAAGCAALAGNFTGNWTADLALVVAYCALLMRGSLAVLIQFFELVPSPIASALFGKQPVPVPAPAPVHSPQSPTPPLGG